MQGASVTVTDFNGNAVTVDLVPVPFNSSIQTAVFEAWIPAMGFSTYFLEFGSGSEKTHKTSVKEVTGATQTISNEFYTLTFNTATGRLQTIQNLVSGVVTEVRGVKCRKGIASNIARSWTKRLPGSTPAPATLILQMHQVRPPEPTFSAPTALKTYEFRARRGS